MARNKKNGESITQQSLSYRLQLLNNEKIIWSYGCNDVELLKQQTKYIEGYRDKGFEILVQSNFDIERLPFDDNFNINDYSK